MTESQDSLIRSHDNRTIKYVRSLHTRHGRAQERAFVVEGARAVEDAMLGGFEPRILLIREDSTEFESLEQSAPIVRIVSTQVFDRLADTVAPQGVLAVFDLPSLPVPETAVPVYLLFDGLRDPGNVGTLLRTAAAAGVDLLLTTSGTVDIYNPKVVRSAMGAHFKLPCRVLDETWEAHLRETCELIAAATLGGDTSYDLVDWTSPVCLVLGSEAHGLHPNMPEFVNREVTIPMHAAIESLNVAAAGAVLLFEISRQRRAASLA